MKWKHKFGTIAEFAGHTFAATLVFCVIGLGALMLHYMRHFLELHGLDGIVIMLLHGLEVYVFFCDAVVYSAWIFSCAFKAIKDF